MESGQSEEMLAKLQRSPPSVTRSPQTRRSGTSDGPDPVPVRTQPKSLLQSIRNYRFL